MIIRLFTKELIKKLMKKNNHLVSIIILNFNGGSLIENCLNSVLKTKYPYFEVIVWDNGSDINEQKKLLKIFKSKVKFIFKEKNYGFAEGNNLAIKFAQGEFIVFLNNDTTVDPNWLSPLLERILKEKEVAFLQPKVIAIENTCFFNYAGAAGGIIDKYGYTFARGRVFDYVEKDFGQYNNESEIFWASGVAMFCRKKVFEKLGGFDSSFFACQEEVDLCFRAFRAGYKNLVVPSSIIYHLGSVTLNRNMAHRVYLNHRNQIIMMVKNMSVNELLYILPIRILLDLGAICYYLVNKNLLFCQSVLKAYSDIFNNLSTILLKRKNDKIKKFGLPKSDAVFNGSIIVDYFLKRKKRYSEIFGKRDSLVPVFRSDSIKNIK